MSNDWSALKDQIERMDPTGNTNQGMGMAWGWQSLSTTSGADHMRRPRTQLHLQGCIVLLSDGLNTQNRWYSMPQSRSTPARRNSVRQRQDHAGITIYTIQVNTGTADPTSHVLQYCASGPENFSADHDGQPDCRTRSSTIGTSLSKLRVAK